MATAFKQEGTDETPEIILDKGNGIFEISGRSLPEDSAKFYGPVLAWINTYSKEPNASTEFVFKLEYFNTSSSKFIQDMLFQLSKIRGVRVTWYHQEDDEDMVLMGEEFSEQTGIPFEFRLY